MNIEHNSIVFFKGTKSRGDSWNVFINDNHFKPRTKEDIYGKVFAIQNSVIWVYIYDKKTDKLLDKCTWGFKEEDL